MITPTKPLIKNKFGYCIDELHERGLEIGLAGSVMINGINAMDIKSDGTPLAPFLSSSLKQLSPDPIATAYFLIVFGLLWLLILLADIKKSLYKQRIFFNALFATVYILIITATLTSAEPKTASLRYVWSGALLLLCFLATLRLYLSEKRGE